MPNARISNIPRENAKYIAVIPWLDHGISKALDTAIKPRDDVYLDFLAKASYIPSMADATQMAALLGSHDQLTFAPIPSGARGLLLAELSKASDSPILCVTHQDRDTEEITQSAAFFAPDAEVIAFPAWDCLPYDRVSPAHRIVTERMQALCQLTQPSGAPRIIVTTASAIIQKLPPHALLKNAQLTLSPGEALDETELTGFLTTNGYQRVSKVMEPGEFALRGGIIDIFPPGSEDAIRLDLFGDDIESIASLDPMTQRSSGALTLVTLSPVNEILMNEERIERFRKGYRDRFGAQVRDDPLYEAISAGRSHPGMEHWLPLFYESVDTLFDYLPNALLVEDYQLEHTLNDRYELLRDYYDARANALENVKQHKELRESPYRPLPPEMFYITARNPGENRGLVSLMEAIPASAGIAKKVVHLTPFRVSDDTPGAVTMGWKNIPMFAKEGSAAAQERIARASDFIQARSCPTLIAASSLGSMTRLSEMLKHHAIQPIPVESASALPAKRSQANEAFLTTLPLSSGLESDALCIITESDLLGQRVIRTHAKKKRPLEVFMQEAAGFDIGELVVHKEHGIGKFDGLVTVEASGTKHDCVKLLYAGDDKLFLPVENIELISRFGSDEDGVQLDKLGGAGWQSRKAKMKERIKLAAEELLKIAAKRALKPGRTLAPADDAYAEFAGRFPYEPTDDQQQAIDDTLSNLASGQSMDRLVCGDVGFGKTEIALRAAFAAVADKDNPVQVAIVAPTTLLARQHMHTFTERFKELPFEIRSLSRLRSAKEQKETHDMLADGRCDIVIGTHALLAEKVAFKNLGLVIVDEEQRFGVKQKEKLKKLRANVHILTLSATPIPRTLQLALSGVRELSLITTPPVDRLAIRSFTMPYDGVSISEAIMREYHRGGQIFYVTPRIKYLTELHVKLRELVPDIKIAIAHGQMAAGELDSIMNEFYEGTYDLLLSTAIIESGIDIPRANTMIIDHAHLFGLAQLYQLRGRVGRGKIRAYCYFTLPPRTPLTQNTFKRLEVMQKLDSLGAGFALASHDMDIRGFGNLLGEEQSGHVREVGVELYQQMLEEAIAKAKDGVAGEDEAADSDWSPQINLGISALIPDAYVEDISLRMGLYRRLANLKNSEDVDDFAAELADRFGSLPREVEQLLDIIRLKQTCRQANIERLDAGPKGAVIQFRDNHFAKPEALISLIRQFPNKYKLRPDQKLVLTKNFPKLKDRVHGVKESVNQIVQLAA